MSKRSRQFKESMIKKITKNVLSGLESNKCSHENKNTNDKTLDLIANALGISTKNLIDYVNNNFNDVEPGEYRFHFYSDEEHTNELKDAFDRGIKYGREQRENELKNQYNFIDKKISNKTVTTKPEHRKVEQKKPESNNQFPNQRNHYVKSLDQIFDEVDAMFNHVFGFKK